MLICFQNLNLCGKLSLHFHSILCLYQFCSVSSHQSFRSHASLYMSFTESVTIDANLTGSKIDAQCYNIPLFDSPFTSILRSIPNLLIQTKIFQISCNQQGEFLVPVLYMKVKMSAPLVFVPAPLHLNDTYVILYLLFQRFFLTYPSFS